MALSRRHFLAGLSAAALSGCGFHLRGSFTLPFESLYIDLPKNSKFGALLTRYLRSGSNVTVAKTLSETQAILKVISDSTSSDVLSYNASGRAREYELKRTLTFKVIDAEGYEFVPSSTVTVARAMTYDESDYSSRSGEEETIRDEMQNDIAVQMIRRIEKAKPKK